MLSIVSSVKLNNLSLIFKILFKSTTGNKSYVLLHIAYCLLHILVLLELRKYV